MTDEPGIDLSIAELELGEHEQKVMDLLLSKPWHVMAMVREAGPMQEIGVMGSLHSLQTGPGSVTITIRVAI